MTWLAPGFLYAAAAIAAAVAALHLLVTRQPRAAVLPTARFVPNLPATATSRATRPSDLLLLMLRILLVMAAGAALAGPVPAASRDPLARVILADISASVGNIEQVKDSVRTLYRQGDLLVVFDSSARRIGGAVLDTVSSLAPSQATGNLSAALVAAIRAGSELRERADSIELIIISPFAAEETDAATDSIRAVWRGRARMVRAGASVDTASRASIAMTTSAAPTDPLLVTMALAGAEREGNVRLLRGEPGEADVQWATGSGHVLVSWPTGTRPPGAVRRSASDAGVASAMIGGVASDSAVVVAAFSRTWEFPSDSLKGARVVARWIDGRPAAVERAAGKGCVRSVAIPVTQVGDLPIRTDFVRLARELTGPCNASAQEGQLAAVKVASLGGNGALAARESFSARADVKSSLAPWLFGLALAAAIAELVVRRRQTQS